MRIEVTAEDIAKGKRLNACSCPIALAARRVGLMEPEVYPAGGADEFQPGHDGELIYDVPRKHCRLPPAASRFIAAFDNGDTSVRPFAFDIEIPQPSTGTKEPR